MFRIAQKSHVLVEDPALENFFHGQPSVCITEGPISLYRDKRAKAQTPEPQNPRSAMVALFVPAYIAVSELLVRLEPFASLVKDSIRILVGTNHSFTCIMDCSAQEVADQLHGMFHLKPFTPANHEYVVALFLDQLDVCPTAPPTIHLEDSLQLPSCLICLERLDSSISGQISTMCNHCSSCDCIHKSQCPVCRLINTGWMDPRCEHCGTLGMVWACLVCGFQGCGRYGKQHALQHARETGHNFSIDLQSQRIWDYEGDCFVHRLIYNRAESQFEYLPDTNEGLPMGKELVDSKLDAKMESITTEYTHMLTSQLESQRNYFMDQINATRKQHGETLCKMKAQLKHLLLKQAKECQALEEVRKEKAKKDQSLANLNRRTQDATEKIKQFEETNPVILQQRDELKAQILELMKKQKSAQDQSTTYIQELQQEIVDLENHLRTLEMVSKHELRDDIGQGVIIPTGPALGTSSKRKTRQTSRR